MSSLRRFPACTGVATLARRIALTPRMIRVTVAGDGFGAAWPIQQPGEIITLLFPAPGEQIVLPLRGWRFPPGAPEQEWRNYTVRRHDPEAGEVDVDVVLHEPRGPACTGAAEAPLGAPVGYAGPRVDYAAHDEAEWLLLCGDETALPAIAAILESAPPVAQTLAVVEVPDPSEEQQLALPDGAELRWVHRNGHRAATSSVVGSSSSSSGVSCASAIASQTRWRWPPTARRRAGRTGHRRVCASALAHGALVLVRPLPQQPLVRVSPARHEVGHRDPVGRRRTLRQEADPPGTCLVGSEAMSAPSSSTVPVRGLSIRTSARSSVDLPQALGPTIAVKPPSGMSTARPCVTTCLS